MSFPAPLPLRIFVVENHADTLTYLRMYLEQLGHVVGSGDSLAAALAGLAEFAPDVLLCDIGLPDGDGWDLLRQAKLPSSIFAIAMSGFGTAADRARSREAGFREHLVKPPDPDALEELLREAGREKAAREG